MKKITLLLILSLASLYVLGQENSLEYGIKGGLNFSSLLEKSNDDVPGDYSGKVGFHMGGFVSISLNQKISLRPELLFSQQGSSFDINGNDPTVFDGSDIIYNDFGGTIKEFMILLPIILEYQMSEAIDIGVGPQFGYSVHRDIEYKNNPLIGFTPLKNEDSEKLELGLNVEAGFTFSEKSRISLRYNYGVTERQNLRSSVVQFSYSYSF